MAKKVIDERTGSVQHPVRPEHISTNPGDHFWDAFGNMETEISAKWIVRLCQRLGGWRAFTGEQIEAFYREAGFQTFMFNRLLDGDNGFVVRGADKKYRVTHEFICRCFGSSPNETLIAQSQTA